MSYTEEFSWDIFINMVDNMSSTSSVTFTKLDRALLWCSWNNLSRQDIIEFLNENRLELGYYYKSDYSLTMVILPDPMEKLSIWINYPVSKSSFREVFRQIWERENQSNLSQN